MPNLNDWGVSYGSISFFEKALTGHQKVLTFKRERDIYFRIKRIDGQEFNVLLVDEYTLGLAAVLKAQAEFEDLEYIVTCANWNGYTKDAKDYGKKSDIGIFNAGEFLGALWWSEPKKYYQKDKDGNPIYPFKKAE